MKHDIAAVYYGLTGNGGRVYTVDVETKEQLNQKIEEIEVTGWKVIGTKKH